MQTYTYCYCIIAHSRSQWPRGLRRGSAAARLLGEWVRIQPWAWMSVCCDCCVLWGRGLCGEVITHPEESYRLWCVVECDLDTSWMRRPWPTVGCRARRKRNNNSEHPVTNTLTRKAYIHTFQFVSATDPLCLQVTIKYAHLSML